MNFFDSTLVYPIIYLSLCVDLLDMYTLYVCNATRYGLRGLYANTLVVLLLLLYSGRRQCRGC